MNLTRRQFSIGTTSALALPFLGCTGNAQSDVTIALTLLVSGLDTAVSVLQSTGGISAAEAAIATQYLNEVTTFIDFVEKELASTDTVLQKSAAIANEAVTLGLKQLPPGLPTVLASVFAAVLNDVAQVLTSVQTTSALLIGRGINSFQSQKKWNGKINSKDKKVLADVAAKNAAIKKKLNALPKK